MNLNAANDYYAWRVQVGHSHRPSGSGHNWSLEGYGCLVHPRIVLTTYKIWHSIGCAQKYNDTAYQPNVKLGNTLFPCQLGHSDPQRDLAALVLDVSSSTGASKQPGNFPVVAGTQPHPGQSLGMLISQHLTSRSRSGGPEADYLCYTFGNVCLLQAQSEEMQFALTGFSTNERYVGHPVFDESGTFYGIVTDLFVPADHPYTGNAATFVVFTPVFSFAKEALKLSAPIS